MKGKHMQNRTHTCNELRLEHVGRKVKISGCMENVRMVCIIKESAGRCACQTPGQLEDRMGSVFQVVREYGCRNVIYNAHKLYLADKKEDLFSAGLWGLRLLFTTESARECVEVAKGYLGLSNYKPNVLTRGLYYRGVD